ncbi:hypothetical protein A3H16_01010 [Candidatus Kaiserbacteria bacterium RIFCSPLOWO2_12_FULL_53_8]|uniref:Beta-lactamase-related domain-containing protein n=2 Tax=Candidatus Kaiseribacteriota TaxID=1752734 RepID=A0A1F6CVY3_9BACT|nr:MAG: hypothetical protein A2851_05705 [Candidatus Kaiserbacteria bacterium RIFCSPHIGHO2_01_FULL_53_29]OGG91764.1 MAG: hypothetical protein A3H16_01010 [Candidatus Kaiserbacteria bacterium RIFCSPLOWO2_12_FULL_53_8]
MLKEIALRVGRALDDKVFPGCVIGIVTKDGDRMVLPFGSFTYAPDAGEVGEDTIYDLASVTKSIPVASLVLTFIDEAKLSPTDVITKYIPELQNDQGATIGDLLLYRVTGPQLSKLPHKTFEEIRTHIFERGFNAPPGEKKYTNVPAFLLGIALERVGGSSLGALAHQYFFEPLGMRDTSFFFTDISRIPPTEIVNGEEIRGLVHDESARVFARARRATGHAGLFSSAPDMLNFLESLLIRDYPFITEGAQKGWGWQSHEPWFMGSHVSRSAFGKTGFTGTSVVVDPFRGIAFVILSNRTYPKRPLDASSVTSAINVFRRDVADILLSAQG